MDAEIRGAEALAIAVVHRDVVGGDAVAGAAVAEDQLARLGRDGGDGVEQAEAGQLTRRVGRESDGGADLGQRRGGFEDVRADPALPQCERQCQAADAAADDRDLHANPPRPRSLTEHDADRTIEVLDQADQ